MWSKIFSVLSVTTCVCFMFAIKYHAANAVCVGLSIVSTVSSALSLLLLLGAECLSSDIDGAPEPKRAKSLKNCRICAPILKCCRSVTRSLKMAKFNKLTEPPVKTANLQGFPAYKLNDEATLTSQAFTTFFGEPKFYKSGGDADGLVKLAAAVAQKDPEYVANLAVYARTVFNMRSVSHALTAILAKLYRLKALDRDYGNQWGLVRRLVNNVVIRPDDMTEIIACYIGMFGKPLPQSLKRGVADCLNRTDSYGMAKYKGNGHEVKMKDLINLCHPKPKDREQEALFKRCLEDKLETPVTWETELSAKGNKKEVWENLIEGKHLGGMACLRNLRNILQAGVSEAHLNEVIYKISNKADVLKSRQLPFRYLSAYKELQDVPEAGSKVFDALETALEHSVDNLPKFDGRTAVIADVSGSMDAPVSKKSKMTCSEIGLLLGSIAAKLSPDTVFLTFDSEVYPQSVSAKGRILSQVKSIQGLFGGGTAVYKPMEYLLTKKIKVDRIILLSDNEANVFSAEYYYNKLPFETFCDRAPKGAAAQAVVNSYRKNVNPDVWVHAVDLQGYGTVQFNPHDNRVNYIAGWSEKLLQFIQYAEAGVTTLVKTVRDFKIDRAGREEAEAA